MEESQFPHYVKSTISEWILDIIEAFVWEKPEDEFDEDFDEWFEYWEINRKEVRRLLPSKVRNAIKQMDGDIEQAHIMLESGFEGSIYRSSIIDVQNGLRIDETPEESLVYGKSMDKFDFAGKPGEIVKQKWENGQWVTMSEETV